MSKLTDIDLTEFTDVYVSCTTLGAVADRMDISVPSVRKLRKMVEDELGIILVMASKSEIATKTDVRLMPDGDMMFVDSGVKVVKLERELMIARRQVRTLKKAMSERMLIDELTVKAVTVLNNRKTSHSPAGIKKRTKALDHGVPVLVLSDMHVGEKVEAKTVGGSNEYNVSVFVKRLDTIIEKCVAYCTSALAPSTYGKIVVALNGDTVSGIIHDELVEHSDVPVLESVLVAVEALSAAFIKLSLSFGSVQVYSTVGNHGRLTPQRAYKGAAENNYDWLVGRLIKSRLEAYSNISVTVATSNDIVYDVEGITILQTHGDHVGVGGQGAAYYSAVERGFENRRVREAAVDVRIDHMIIGHVHHYATTNNTTTNGSLIGESEYSYLYAFGGEKPTQALFFCHKKHGIIYRVGLTCNE